MSSDLVAGCLSDWFGVCKMVVPSIPILEAEFPKILVSRTHGITENSARTLVKTWDYFKDTLEFMSSGKILAQLLRAHVKLLDTTKV